IKGFKSLESRRTVAPDVDFFVCSVVPLDGCFESYNFSLEHSIGWVEFCLPGFSDGIICNGTESTDHLSLSRLSRLRLEFCWKDLVPFVRFSLPG
ncbi:hypothetical protein AVEN_178784-1, partial [Araneus ventricosus]